MIDHQQAPAIAPDGAQVKPAIIEQRGIGRAGAVGIGGGIGGDLIGRTPLYQNSMLRAAESISFSPAPLAKPLAISQRVPGRASMSSGLSAPQT